MTEFDVIGSMLNDLSQEQPIHTALCIGYDVQKCHQQHIQWRYFNVSELLNLPFTQRYDFALIAFNTLATEEISIQQKTQSLVKLRDLMAKRISVIAKYEDEHLLRSLGFTQLLQDLNTEKSDDISQFQKNTMLWQFNILNYKHVPDWFNSKFWANPENWDKFRW